MTHLKRCLCMLVLTIMLVPTISNAKTYESKENVFVPEEITNTFNQHYGKLKYYTYFPYACEDYTCYYAIDENNNYFDIKYNSTGVEFEKGIDNEFVVTGDNIYNSHFGWDFVVVIVSIIFFLIIGLIYIL